MPASTIPASYCGMPPLPGDLWQRWNFDPVLLGVLALGAGLFWYAGRRRSPTQNWAFGSGMLALLVIFISPLCALTVALFSARVVHHVLLVAVAAPLLAMAFVGKVAASPKIGGTGQASALAKLLAPALMLHTVTFWLWHAPDAYAAALSSTPVYWLMQITLLSTATLLWATIFVAPTGRAILALLFSTIQMGMLGALLAFSSQALYLPHLTTTLAFGLDPLGDQQLAGLIMWVPAALPYLGMALYRLLAWLPRAGLPA